MIHKEMQVFCDSRKKESMVHAIVEKEISLNQKKKKSTQMTTSCSRFAYFCFITRTNEIRYSLANNDNYVIILYTYAQTTPNPCDTVIAP